MSSFLCALCAHSVMYHHQEDQMPSCSICDCRVYVSQSVTTDLFGSRRMYHAGGLDINDRQVDWVSWDDTIDDDTHVRYTDGSLAIIKGVT